MLNRASRISNRPYVKLLFEVDVKPLSDLPAIREHIRKAVASQPSFIMVELDSTIKVGATTAGFGKGYINAEIRYITSADGLTFDTTLKPLDCLSHVFGVGCEIRLKDASIITQTQVSANTGGTSAQQAASTAVAPASGIVQGITSVVSSANTTVRYLSIAAVVLGTVYIVRNAKPLVSGVRRAFRR